MTTKRATAPPAEDAPRDATVEEATAAQRDSDTAALAGHYTEDAIAAATPAATPPAEGQKASSDAATVTATEETGAALATDEGTWEDWMPPGMRRPVDDELLTRAELVERLRQMNVAVTNRTLVHWETRGALPRPVRRWYRGATRATYAPWVAEAAAQVPRLRREGLSFPEIGERLRAAPAERRLASADAATVEATATATVDATPTAPSDADLEGSLAAFAQRYYAVSGIPVAAIEVRVTGANGAERVHRFPPPRD